MSKQNELINAVEDALDAVLDALIQEREINPREGSMMTLGKLTPEQMRRIQYGNLIDLAERPKTTSLELAVRHLGIELHEAGLSAAEMGDVAHKVAERGGQNVQHRLAIMQSKWDRIGNFAA